MIKIILYKKIIMKKIREEQIEKQSNDLKNIMKLLSLINSTINDIRKSAQKKYSLLSSVLNCFYKKKLFLFL